MAFEPQVAALVPHGLLIQHIQNRDLKAINLKLNEIIFVFGLRTI